MVLAYMLCNNNRFCCSVSIFDNLIIHFCIFVCTEDNMNLKKERNERCACLTAFLPFLTCLNAVKCKTCEKYIYNCKIDSLYSHTFVANLKERDQKTTQTSVKNKVPMMNTKIKGRLNMYV